MIVIYTDASTKNGYSCWAYKEAEGNTVVSGIIKTSNSAGAENYAVLRALEAYPDDPLMIITDSLVTAELINTDRYTRNKAKRVSLFQDTAEAIMRHVVERPTYLIGIHIKSDDQSYSHQVVDHIAKTHLDFFLKARKIKRKFDRKITTLF